MSQPEYRIIKTLDNSSRFLFWDVEECVILAALLLLGGALESIFVMLSGLIFWFVYRKFKKANKKNGIVFFHYIYWNLPTQALRRSGKFQNLPCSHKRDIIL